jgi:hypothetical protein
MDRVKKRPADVRLWRVPRLLAMLVIAFGVYTFFMPMLILTTHVLGRAEWSSFHMALEVHSGRLPANRPWIELTAVEDAFVYLLMLTALALALFPWGQNALYHVSLVGSIVSALATRNATHHLAEFVTGSPDVRAKFGPAMYLLPLTMLALFLLARSHRVADRS